jgi:Transposase DNA-binding/Transposase Tn5 dimerisation domain
VKIEPAQAPTRRASLFWLVLMGVLAASVAHRLGAFDLWAVIETTDGALVRVSNGYTLVDHPFHVVRAETLRRELTSGSWLGWIGQHQGGYPVEFYPLGVAGLEVVAWWAAFGSLPMIAIHKLVVIGIFLAPMVAFGLVARFDRRSLGIALLASAAHLCIRGWWWSGGSMELVEWGLVTNVAAATALLIALPLCARYLQTGSRLAGGFMVVTAVFALYANPRSGIALATLLAGCAVASLTEPSPLPTSRQRHDDEAHFGSARAVPAREQDPRMSPANWADVEMASADFGDPRRSRRAVQVLSALAAQPDSSVPEACGDWAATKGAYRFWDNEAIEADALLASHREATVARGRAYPAVLAIQDTTQLDFSSRAKMTGIGPLGNAWTTGLHVHSVLMTALDGLPLGVIHQHVWARDETTTGIAATRRTRPTADKESQRWLDGLAAAQAAIPAPTQVITVADREADIFDLFAQERPPHSELLIRSAHDRTVRMDPVAYLWPVARAAAVLGEVEITVPRQGNRKERQALLTLRVAPVALQPPRSRRRDRTLPPIPVTAILAEERTPPDDQPALCWLLLTTLDVPDFATARACLDWYRQRWTIERFHFVLKSGCQMEHLQLHTAERMTRALATLTIVAWRLHALSELARSTPSAPCTVALSALQWRALYATIHKTTTIPSEPVSLAQAIRWIAQLGGFLARKGDGDPGVKTIWRGWRKLDTITTTWALFDHSPSIATSG